MNEETRDDLMPWLVLAVVFSVLAFVPSAVIFVVTYLRGLGLQAELLSQKIPDPALVAASDANIATCFVAAVVTVVSGFVGLVAGITGLFRWQRRHEGPTYPTGG